MARIRPSKDKAKAAGDSPRNLFPSRMGLPAGSQRFEEKVGNVVVTTGANVGALFGGTAVVGSTVLPKNAKTN